MADCRRMIARDFNRHPMRMDRDGCSNATRTATLLGTTRDGEKGRVGLSSQVREPTVADRTEGRPPAIMTWAFGAGALTGPTRRPQEKGSKTRNQTTPEGNSSNGMPSGGTNATQLFSEQNKSGAARWPAQVWAEQ